MKKIAFKHQHGGRRGRGRCTHVLRVAVFVGPLATRPRENEASVTKKCLDLPYLPQPSRV